MLNKVILIGNLGKDPQVVKTETFHKAFFSLAVTHKYKQEGETKQQTLWVNINVFGSLAEIAGKYLKKGSKVCIEGKLQQNKYTDKNGKEHDTLIVVGHSLIMLEKRKEGGDEEPEVSVQESKDDDLPF